MVSVDYLVKYLERLYVWDYYYIPPSNALSEIADGNMRTNTDWGNEWTITARKEWILPCIGR